MIRVLLVASEKENLADLAEGIQAQGDTRVMWAASGAAALAQLAADAFDLVVADEQLGDQSGLALTRQVVATDPMVNTALVSTLPPEAYHEASEGLGVLMQLPPHPGPSDARRLMDHLGRILGLGLSTGR